LSQVAHLILGDLFINFGGVAICKLPLSKPYTIRLNELLLLLIYLFIVEVEGRSMLMLWRLPETSGLLLLVFCFFWAPPHDYLL